MGYFFLMLLFVLVFLFGVVLSAIDDDIEERRMKAENTLLVPYVS